MWALPTRGRPNSLKRFAEAYLKTQSTTKIFVRLDDDDTFLKDYLTLTLPGTFIVRVGPRQGLRSAMNEVLELYPNEPYYGLGADDLVPQTIEWDKKLFEISGTTKISFPNDLGKKSKKDLPTHPCVGGDLVRAIGWFGLPTVYHFYLDDTWKYIGQHLNCITRLDDVIVEHVHYSRQKSEFDQTYKETTNHYKNDGASFAEWEQIAGPLLIQNLKGRGF
jgi:hypothetical protein